MLIDIVVYDGLDEMDAFGPLEVPHTPATSEPSCAPAWSPGAGSRWCRVPTGCGSSLMTCASA